MGENYLIIRVDANTQMGIGHLMRCLALAQAWKAQGGQVTFITACESDALRRRLLNEGFEVLNLEKSHPHPEDWNYTSQVLAKYPKAWVVVDGYHFASDYQLRVKEAGHPLLVIDDMAHLDHYYADIVLNQNLHAENLRYSHERYTRLLLGTKYVLLRQEFLKWRGWKREIPEVARKVLVTLGGSDPDNVTLKVIQALQQVEVDGLEAVVVIGSLNPHLEELWSVVQGLRIPIRLESNVVDMSQPMAWADVAVSGGGTAIWELAFMGVPVIGLSRAKQEVALLQRVTQSGISVNLGGHHVELKRISQLVTSLAHNEVQRLAMSQAGHLLVDGLGSVRVINVMKRGQ